MAYFPTLIQNQQVRSDWLDVTSTTENLKGVDVLTKWGEGIERAASKNNVWGEYPRPQLRREAWLNLNGLWQYAIAPRTAPKPVTWDGEILVPFAVESPLSGVQKSVTSEERVWYQRALSLPDEWQDQRIILHFGAVDFEAVVWINDAYVGSHRGGFDPFWMDITDFIQPDTNTLTVAAWDPSSLGDQPRGKQHVKPQGIWYTSVTGIWQTVWLEPVPKEAHIEEIRIRSDLSDSSITLELLTARPSTRQTLAARIRVMDGDTEVAAVLMRPDRRVTIKIPAVRSWSPADPHLYDLVAELVAIEDPFLEEDKGKEQTGRWPRHGKLEADKYLNARVTGEPLDCVTAYFGMREIKLGPGSLANQPCLQLNGKAEFHIGPLDQGWWPDGLLTPPSDEAIIYELEFLKAAGFTCLRKHIKVEPERYYYHCDRIGLMVWQDMPCAFAPAQHVAPFDETEQVRKSSTNQQFELELRRMVDHLANHPSIVMWIIQNEGWGQYDSARLTRWLKDLDPDRIVSSSSGWLDLGVGEVKDKHDYSPTPQPPDPDPARALVMGEYGGIGWPVEGHLWNSQMRNWGYQTYHDQQQVKDAYRQKTEGIIAMRDIVGVCGAIYTQTSDVEGEINGLLTYDRKVEKLPRQWLQEMHKLLTDP